MKPIWEVDPKDVESLQGDSRRFIRFMNAILAAQARVGDIPDAEVSLNEKEAEGDGGVDAAIHRAALSGRDSLGYLDVPTCWQFKAQPTGNIKPKNGGKQEDALREEISKPHAKKLIETGYGYRFCIAADLTDQKKAEWEGWLDDEARQINPAASRARVLGASDLALWASRYPAVAGQFRPYLNKLKSLLAWHRDFEDPTQEFVPPATWEVTAESVHRHIDFSRRITTALTIHGEAGVGKSRSICEALRGDAAREALVAVTTDEQFAKEFAQIIAENPDTRAVLVADECSLKYRVDLERIAQTCSDRLRIIAIDNQLQRDEGPNEIRLKRLTSNEVAMVLERNFPRLPTNRRITFVELAGGFVRLAVDLWRHDHLIPPDGRIDSAFGFFHDHYLQGRLPLSEDREAIELVSLLTRVGYRDDVKHELDALCSLSPIDLRATDIVKAANRLKQSPGFIAFAGRYLYVTPSLIAQVAFQAAWNRWVEPDPAKFLAALPETLMEPFTQRVETTGTAAMRQTVAHFFLTWARTLGPPDLGSEAVVSRLVRLVEIDVALYLPLLRSLIEKTPIDELQRLHSANGDGPNTRRALVWLAEKLAYFPERFPDAEAMLFRLAQAETEPHLGNSASGVWASFFRAGLSGTTIPFNERLNLLERRFQELPSTRFQLGLAAFDDIFEDGPVFRLAFPPIVFGRLPPSPWQPADLAQLRECHRAALRLAARLTARGGEVAAGIRDGVIRRLSSLVRAGYLDEVRAVIGPPPLTDKTLTDVVRELEWLQTVLSRVHEPAFRAMHEKPNGASKSDPSHGSMLHPLFRDANEELVSRVQEWYRSLILGDLHSRLVGLVGQEVWHQRVEGDRNAWQTSLDALAAELLRSPTSLERELIWLCSPDASSAFQFGQSLAKADTGGTLLDRMLGDIPRNGGLTLSRGYVEQIATTRPDFLPRVNERLDRIQAEDPKIAYEMIWSAGDEVRKVSRLFAMIDQGQLTAQYLQPLVHGVRERSLTEDELLGATDRLLHAADSGDDRAASLAVCLINRAIHWNNSASGGDRLQAFSRVRAILPRVLELALAGLGQQSDFWMELADDLAAIEPETTVRLIVKSLESRDSYLQWLAEDRLIALAKSQPGLVMTALGEMVLSPISGTLTPAGKLSRVLAALPLPVVEGWINRVGLKGARGIARHLALPELDKARQPVLHPLTEWVLSRYEDDAQVFLEFSAGRHNGQVYSGDIASEHEREGEVARKFLDHPLRRVREWAVAEIEWANRETGYWRQRDEEAAMPL